jgi:hypothetical protein
MLPILLCSVCTRSVSAYVSLCLSSTVFKFSNGWTSRSTDFSQQSVPLILGFDGFSGPFKLSFYVFVPRILATYLSEPVSTFATLIKCNILIQIRKGSFIISWPNCRDSKFSDPWSVSSFQIVWFVGEMRPQKRPTNSLSICKFVGKLEKFVNLKRSSRSRWKTIGIWPESIKPKTFSSDN